MTLQEVSRRDGGAVEDLRCPVCKTAVVILPPVPGESYEEKDNVLFKCVCGDWTGTEPEEDTPHDPDPNMVIEDLLPEDTYKIEFAPTGQTLFYIPGTYQDDNPLEADERAIGDAYDGVSGADREAYIYFKNENGEWSPTVKMTGSGGGDWS